MAVKKLYYSHVEVFHPRFTQWLIFSRNRSSSIMKKSSFTMIELLVVIGIIALLAGLVIPAVNGARVTARKTACLSNQGQIMKIITQSMNDNNQFLASGNTFTANSTTAAWSRYLFDKKRLLSLEAARCTALRSSAKKELGDGTDDTDWQQALSEVYGMVYGTAASKDSNSKDYAGFDFRGTKALTDSGSHRWAPSSLALGACAVVSSTDPDTAKALISFAGTSAGRPANIHGGECNFFFLDGHGESLIKDAITKKVYPTVSADGSKEKTSNAVKIASGCWLDVD